MITAIAVNHFAIIHRLEVSFNPGFNLLSGETGAGKSILVGAVNLILGGRASQEMIQTGQNEAAVEALFDIQQKPAIRDLLVQWELPSGEELVVRRIIHRSGRNRVLLNGQLVTLQQLQQLTAGLVSVSGQHEHQQLLNPDNHLELLDSSGNLAALRQEVAQTHGLCSRAQEKLHQVRQDRARRASHLELMQFQLVELEEAQLRPDEDSELERERTLLRHAATLEEIAEHSYDILYARKGAILEQLGQVRAHLQRLAQIDLEQKALLDQLEQARLYAEELAHALHQYRRRIRSEPQRLADIEERLAAIQRLAKKYGGRVSQLLEHMDKLRAELARSEDDQLHEQQLEAELAEFRKAYLEKALALSRERRQAAARLTRQIQETLAALDMSRARFAVTFNPAQVDERLRDFPFTPSGIDRVEFFLSANPGEDLKPLARVASGGELSRILLAIKSALRNGEQAETLIFDEVDAGIGGRTAELVGMQLAELAQTYQVICITHLPQIARYAEHHYKVTKETDGKESRTSIRALTIEERIQELARMLGGISISEKALAHARELVESSDGGISKRLQRGK